MVAPRTSLSADPAGLFLHDVILQSADRHPENTAIVDTSDGSRFTYSEYADTIDVLARNLCGSGIVAGDIIAIYLPNSWECCVAYHGATLAGAIPTLLNPSYREREVRYQLENSGAKLLITDGPLIKDMNLAGLALRRIVVTRAPSSTAGDSFCSLLRSSSSPLPSPANSPQNTLAALPYSSGTTGLPKGVMLTHANLVTNIYQTLGTTSYLDSETVALGFLPLYHIYGLNVVLNIILSLGATLVLMPRWGLTRALDLITRENVTWIPMVPPVVLACCQAAEAGQLSRDHRVGVVMCGAAPLSAKLARRFTSLTGIRVVQGYGMTEASPVTHIGYLEDPYYNPESIGSPVALTDCRILGESGDEVPPGEPGELVMRGPQFMRGYWNAPDATSAVLRDGWYYSGDIAAIERDQYFVVDRRKEMIKYKGFPVAPAEVEAVLLEHPAVRDCGVIGRPDAAVGEIPCAFVVLRDGRPGSVLLEDELCSFVADRLTAYKQPRDIRFVSSIPRNPSGKILRRELRGLL
jgi:acyl-CoA synthetase (AMP-forming)/AMP-acid ligase II